MTSASRNSFIRVMSVPVFAMSTSKSRFFEKCMRTKMQKRSHRKFHCCFQVVFSPMTVRQFVVFSLTSMRAFSPLLFSASISRLAATAAPPVCSLVFTISIRMFVVFRDANVEKILGITFIFMSRSCEFEKLFLLLQCQKC